MARREIAGKVIVITGASSGIGAASARRLAGRGAKVVLAARRAERLSALVDEIERAGGQALAVPTDVADEAACQALIAAAVERFGRVDVLVNNAGLGYRNLAGDLDPAQVREQIEVNVLGPIWCANAVIPVMLAQGAGQIINIGSVAGTIGLPGSPVYTATKYALDGFSQATRAELAGSGVDVTLVCPGYVETEFGVRTPASSARKKKRPLPAPVMSSDYMAGRIAGLIERPRRKVVVTWHYQLASGLNRFFPGLTAWLAGLLGRRAARRRKVRHA